MRFSLGFPMLLLCNLVVSQVCNERETDCFAPRQCATCLSRRNGSPQTVCSTPRTALQPQDRNGYQHDYCDGSYSMCKCAKKVYRAMIPPYGQFSEQSFSEQPKIRENKENKEQQGMVPTKERSNNVPFYMEVAPFMKQLEVLPISDPSPSQFMPPPNPFTGVDNTIAFNAVGQDLDQEMDPEEDQNFGYIENLSSTG